MSTQSQDRKVQLVEALDVAAGDSEMYGQRLGRAITDMWTAATNDDPQKLTSAFAAALDHRASLDAVIDKTTEAILTLTDGPDFDKIRGLVNRVEKSVREEERCAGDSIRRALRQLRDALDELPEVARGGLHRENIGGVGPRSIADQCCCELSDLEQMVSMVENAVDASSNLPVEMDGAKQVLSYIQHQLKLTRNLLIDCLSFIQDPEVQS